MFLKNVVKQLTEYLSKYLSWYFLTLRYFLRRPRCTKASPLWPSLGRSSPFSPLLPSWTCLQVSWQLFWLEILAWLWLRFWKSWVSWARLSGRREPSCTGWCLSRLDRSSNKIQPVPQKVKCFLLLDQGIQLVEGFKNIFTADHRRQLTREHCSWGWWWPLCSVTAFIAPRGNKNK